MASGVCVYQRNIGDCSELCEKFDADYFKFQDTATSSTVDTLSRAYYQGVHDLLPETRRHIPWLPAMPLSYSMQTVLYIGIVPIIIWI